MEEEHKVAEVEIAARRNVVWQALRDPAEIRRWFGWETPDIEAEIAMIFVDGAEADEATGIIQFGEWEGVADRFELDGRADKTILSVVRSGTPPEGGWEASHNEVIEAGPASSSNCGSMWRPIAATRGGPCISRRRPGRGRSRLLASSVSGLRAATMRAISTRATRCRARCCSGRDARSAWWWRSGAAAC